MGFWHNFFQAAKHVIEFVNGLGTLAAAILAIAALIAWVLVHFH